ncbi:hypothetical protein UVI_02063550 [Ustilaginoidea virens]|uniref:Uncharacterized protein n=1 Tax=Ustilaginoidea virens TaxID=1159556 RepID=A0A1B5L6J1_USTVR|nr:hypothetical protein UVI_02063550 [Ustilaginoidea virens]
MGRLTRDQAGNPGGHAEQDARPGGRLDDALAQGRHEHDDGDEEDAKVDRLDRDLADPRIGKAGPAGSRLGGLVTRGKDVAAGKGVVEAVDAVFARFYRVSRPARPRGGTGRAGRTGYQQIQNERVPKMVRRWVQRVQDEDDGGGRERQGGADERGNGNDLVYSHRFGDDGVPSDGNPQRRERESCFWPTAGQVIDGGAGQPSNIPAARTATGEDGCRR